MIPASFPHQHTSKMPTRFTRSSDSCWGNYSQHQKGRHLTTSVGVGYNLKNVSEHSWSTSQLEEGIYFFSWKIFLLYWNLVGRGCNLKRPWVIWRLLYAHPPPHSLGGWDSPGQLKNHCSYPLQTYVDCTAVEKFFMPTMCMINEHPNYVSLILKRLCGLYVVLFEICVFDILAL